MLVGISQDSLSLTMLPCDMNIIFTLNCCYCCCCYCERMRVFGIKLLLGLFLTLQIPFFLSLFLLTAAGFVFLFTWSGYVCLRWKGTESKRERESCGANTRNQETYSHLLKSITINKIVENLFLLHPPSLSLSLSLLCTTTIA